MTTLRIIIFTAILPGWLAHQTIIATAQDDRASTANEPAAAEPLYTAAAKADLKLQAFNLQHTLALSAFETVKELYPETATSMDQRGNLLIVRGTPSQIEEVSHLIEVLDVPPATGPFTDITRQSQADDSDGETGLLQPHTSDPRGWSMGLQGLDRSVQSVDDNQVLRDTLASIIELGRQAGGTGEPVSVPPELKAEVRTQVEAAFRARQQLQVSELQILQLQLERIRKSITARESVKDQIIDDRVDQLLAAAMEIPGPPVVRGQVITRADNQTVDISIGADDGLQRGMRLRVRSGKTDRGDIEVIDVQSDRSHARILSEDSQNPIQPGNVVTTVIALINRDNPGLTPTVRSVSNPKVLSMNWDEAEKVLTAADLKVKLRRGKVATKSEDIFKVYEQLPAAGTTMRAGDSVILTLFVSDTISQPAIDPFRPTSSRELRTTIEELQVELQAHQAAAERNPKRGDIDAVMARLRLTQRKLDVYRAELAAQKSLAELELKDARSELDHSLRTLDSAQTRFKSGFVKEREVLDSERAVEKATFRFKRAETLLNLFQKVDRPEEATSFKPQPRKTPTPDDTRPKSLDGSPTTPASSREKPLRKASSPSL